MAKKGRQFLANAVLLSCVQILLRGVAVSFNAYIHEKIGAESMGLFTLVMSVYGFVLTLALSCVNLAAVRLTSERCACLEMQQADRTSWRYTLRHVMLSVCSYSLLCSVLTGAGLYAMASWIGTVILRDVRTIRSLRVIAWSLPAISLSAAISGYFTGLRKVYKNAITAISEQGVKIAVTSTALVLLHPGDVEAACTAVVGGCALAEAWSLLTNIFLYWVDSGRSAGARIDGENVIHMTTGFRDTVRISLPSAAGAYARQGLTMLEHLAIPRGLQKSGLTSQAALVSYGALQGIAFPLVMFPYAVIGSFTSLLIPEMTERAARKDGRGMAELTRNVYHYTALFSLGACGLFVNYAEELGEWIYHSGEAAQDTFLLGLLVPCMYLDTAVDALLKGMGEQVYVMKINILDAGCGLLLVLLLTPVFGIRGYILTVWICEIGNLYFSILHLGKLSGEGIRQAARAHAGPLLLVAGFSCIHWFFFSSLYPPYGMIMYACAYLLAVHVLFSDKNVLKKRRNKKRRPASASLP